MRYRAGELAADRLIHLTGTLAGVVGSAIMVGIAADVADRSTFLASLVYSVCLLTMLGCSAAYNLASNAPRRRLLRRFDHAAIFLMIAGTYTPFNDVPTTWRLGDRNDSRGMDWSGHRSRHEADLSTSYRASFHRCLPGSGLDNTSGGEAPAKLRRHSDGGFARSWRRALYYRDRLSPLAGAAFPQRNMAQLRAGRSQLSLRSYSARRCLGTTLSAG